MEYPSSGNDHAMNVEPLAVTTMKNAKVHPVRIAPQVRRPDLHSKAVSKTAEGRGAKILCGDCSDHLKDANSRLQWTSHTDVYLHNAPALPKHPTFKGSTKEEHHSRIGKMLDGLAPAIRRDRQEWVIKEESPAFVKIITDAVKPVSLHRAVTEEMALTRNKPLKKDVYRFIPWLREYAIGRERDNAPGTTLADISERLSEVQVYEPSRTGVPGYHR
ncbi:hypothetical protein DYB28_011699 [Aphanomyces astaci]|uniref:Uncharacterized protein n=1 Tax=Aphanomyces astaci TaxID=112090 RepID=A0A9X8DWN0_APHAT|nr:hypothetical protein DYB28_011699 [Aphanomyces astaci]